MAAAAIGRALGDGALEGEHAPALTIKDSIDALLGPMVFNHILIQLSSNMLALKSQSQVTASLCKNVKDLDNLFSSFVELRGGFITEAKGRFAVAVDSVSEILNHVTTSLAAAHLSSLRSHDKDFCVLWLLHEDLHETKATAAFEYVSSMIASAGPIIHPINGQRVNSKNLSLIEQNFGRGKIHVCFKRGNGWFRLMFEELHVEHTFIKFTAAAS